VMMLRYAETLEPRRPRRDYDSAGSWLSV
jgi:hypothetical protein